MGLYDVLEEGEGGEVGDGEEEGGVVGVDGVAFVGEEGKVVG